MIDAIIGQKGSGKTALLVNEISERSKTMEHIVCLEYGKRFDHQIPYQVRLIDMTEYPVASYAELVSFLSGLSAMNYDLGHIYIDSIYKVVQNTNPAELAEFIHRLRSIPALNELNITITVSDAAENLPADVLACVRN